MNTFTAIEYVILNIAALILGADKMAFAQRIDLVNASKTKLKSAIKQIKDPDDKALALMAYHQLMEAKEGYVHTPCLMDWCSSGASILSAIMRDPKGMQSCGVVDDENIHKSSMTPGNLYQRFTDNLNKKLGTNFIKSEVKGASVPFYYGGDKNVHDLLAVESEEETAKRVEGYHAMYKEALPGAYQFRQAALDAWPEDAKYIEFMAPDGYEVSVPVLSDAKGQGVEIKHTMLDENGKTVEVKTKVVTKFKTPEARPMYVETPWGSTYRNNHTKGLGAHMIHALDAYILREIVRMSKMTMAEAYVLVEKHLRGSVIVDTTTYPRELKNAIEAWYNTGVANIRVLHILKYYKYEGVYDVPEDMLEAIKECMKYLPTREFDVIHIHDEFGALPQHMNELRKFANVVYANIYKGHVAEYYSERFGMRLEAGKYDEELYETLLNVDYLLS